MYCRQCGYNNDEYSKVCHRCGSIMREAEDLYDRESVEQEQSQEPSVLKYARKSEDIVSKLKAPFRKLERANRKQKTSILAIIAAAVVVLCLCVWITVLGVKACNTVEETVYGNSSANIAQNAIAAMDGSFIYYSCPFGTNPGLYRMSISSGETLKISYLCMECLCVADGWVYGITPEGIVMRVSTDGLSSQQVIEEQNVSRLTLVDDMLYYLGRECRLCRADLTTLTRRSLAKCERVGSSRMTEFAISSDMIYYIELPEDEYTELFTKSEIRHNVGEDGKETEENAYTYTEFIEPEGKDIPLHAGCVWQMLPDGTEASELLGTPVKMLTAGSGYLYFQSETTVTIKAIEIDPKAPEDMDYELETTKCWRLELETLKYSAMLDTRVAGSGMNPADDGRIYYITVNGTLERTTNAGKERFDVLTYEQTVDRFAIVGNRIFALCDGGRRMIMLDADSTDVTLLCEKTEEQLLAETTTTTATMTTTTTTSTSATTTTTTTTTTSSTTTTTTTTTTSTTTTIAASSSSTAAGSTTTTTSATSANAVG